MKINEQLARVRLNLRDISAQSGVSLAYVKEMSSGRRPASVDARNRIAAALRRHAGTLMSAAQQMESA